MSRCSFIGKHSPPAQRAKGWHRSSFCGPEPRYQCGLWMAGHSCIVQTGSMAREFSPHGGFGDAAGLSACRFAGSHCSAVRSCGALEVAVALRQAAGGTELGTGDDLLVLQTVKAKL